MKMNVRSKDKGKLTCNSNFPAVNDNKNVPLFSATTYPWTRCRSGNRASVFGVSCKPAGKRRPNSRRRAKRRATFLASGRRRLYGLLGLLSASWREPWGSGGGGGGSAAAGAGAEVKKLRVHSMMAWLGWEG